MRRFALHGGEIIKRVGVPEVESRLTWHVTLRICKIERIGQILRRDSWGGRQDVAWNLDVYLAVRIQDNQPSTGNS